MAQPGGNWSETFTSDNQGRLKTIQTQDGVYTYHYQGAGPLVQEIELPGGNYITNLFDTSGVLADTWLNKSDGTVLDHHGYTCDSAFDRKTATWGTGAVHLDYGYDSIGQLTNAVGYETSGTGSPRLNEKFGFAYDPAGNLKGRTKGALTQQFLADNLDELTNITRGASMTVAGQLTLAPQSGSLTVNGVSAQVYNSDLSFATASGVSLSDGNNTFTTSLKNSSGQTLTKTLTQNLPVSVSLEYDYDGNMTSDGLHTLEYDDADRLTTVSVANAWREEFTYDALWRRRITKKYGWNGSGWGNPTNEVHYIYDRMLPIRERNSANNPLVTYTRGLDLSGTFQGAGGIGGLLARTDASGATYYFADGSGNITTLINSSGVRQAAYTYGPFGNLVSMSGPLAAGNHYRFSSKEVDPLSGDYYFGFRFDSPNLQRWRNADPIGLWGGLNMHEFSGNSPLNFLDPYGLSWWNPFTWWDPPGLKISPNGDMSLPPLPLPDRNSFGYLHGIDNDFNGKTGGELVGDIGKSILKDTLLSAAGALGPEDEGLYDLLGNARKCEKAAKAAESVADEVHHLLPQSKRLRGFFERAGLNIEDYTIPMNKATHRLLPNGIHTGPSQESWNGVWERFFEEHRRATKDEILDQLARMRKHFGI